MFGYAVLYDYVTSFIPHRTVSWRRAFIEFVLDACLLWETPFKFFIEELENMSKTNFTSHLISRPIE